MVINSVLKKVLIVLSSVLILLILVIFNYIPNNPYIIEVYGHSSKICNAMPVAEDIVVTAWHCNQFKKRNIKINGQLYQIKRIRTVTQFDLEIFQTVDYKFDQWVTFANGPTTVGYIYGEGCGYHSSIGRVGFYYGVVDNVKPQFANNLSIQTLVYQVPMHGCQGDSGGIVLNNKNQLIGMTSMIEVIPSHYNVYVIDSSQIKRILNETFHTRKW